MKITNFRFGLGSYEAVYISADSLQTCHTYSKCNQSQLSALKDLAYEMCTTNSTTQETVSNIRRLYSMWEAVAEDALSQDKVPKLRVRDMIIYVENDKYLDKYLDSYIDIKHVAGTQLDVNLYVVSVVRDDERVFFEELTDVCKLQESFEKYYSMLAGSTNAPFRAINQLTTNGIRND